MFIFYLYNYIIVIPLFIYTQFARARFRDRKCSWNCFWIYRKNRKVANCAGRDSSSSNQPRGTRLQVSEGKRALSAPEAATSRKSGNCEIAGTGCSCTFLLVQLLRGEKFIQREKKHNSEDCKPIWNVTEHTNSHVAEERKRERLANYDFER